MFYNVVRVEAVSAFNPNYNALRTWGRLQRNNYRRTTLNARVVDLLTRAQATRLLAFLASLIPHKDRRGNNNLNKLNNWLYYY